MSLLLLILLVVLLLRCIARMALQLELGLLSERRARNDCDDRTGLGATRKGLTNGHFSQARLATETAANLRSYWWLNQRKADEGFLDRPATRKYFTRSCRKWPDLPYRQGVVWRLLLLTYRRSPGNCCV